MKPQHLHAFILISLLMFIQVLNLSAAEPRYHSLKKGDTLFSISRIYSIPYEALAAANGITDPTRLKVGDRLVIPELYKVESGDTLAGIARSFGITIDTVRKANLLGPQSVIQPGDILVIPASRFLPGAPKVKMAVDTIKTAVTVPATTTTSTVVKPTGTVVTSPVKTLPASPSTSPAPKPAAQSPLASTTKILSPTTTSIQDITTTSNPASISTGASLKLPPDVSGQRTSMRTVDRKLIWPCSGEYLYLDGKLEGIMIRTLPGEISRAVAGGIVVSAGPARGFGLVAFVQSVSGYIYVYGGNDKLLVGVGDQIKSGQEMGIIGIDSKDGGHIAYFIVFRDGTSLDPAKAPRE